MIRTIKLKKLALNLALPIAVGLLGSLFTKNAGEVYANLNRPPLSPPAWIFAVVWTILYLLMGVAAYLIAESNCKYKKRSQQIYLICLALNLIWPMLFFGLEWFVAALIVLIVLWLFVFAAAVLFYFCSDIAGYLMIPYVLWLSFAAYLNIAIVFLN